MEKAVKIIFLVIVIGLIFYFGKNRAAEAVYNHGKQFYERGLYEKAAFFFGLSLELGPHSVIARHALASAYHEMGKENLAEDEYRKVLLLDKKHVPAYRGLADIYASRKDYEKAAQILEEGLKTIPGSPDLEDSQKRLSSDLFAQKLERGNLALMEGRVMDAREDLRKAIEADPRNPQAYYSLACLYYTERDHPGAEMLLEDALRLAPDFYPARKLLGDIFFARGKFAEAIGEYRRIMSLKGEDPEILNNIGISYMNLEKYDRAVPFLEKAVSVSPEDIDLRYGLASVYRDKHMLNEAVVQYLKVIKSRPDYRRVHNDLGDIYKEQGREKESLEEYRKEIRFSRSRLKANPDDPLDLTEAAYAYNGIGESDHAKTLIGKALAIDPRYQRGYWVLAQIYRDMARPEEAIRTLEVIQRMSPQRLAYVDSKINDIRKEYQQKP
ncbi:MAG: TPR repeat-containing protein YrrB [Candidatus Omnitrophica bacterium ADurb.Bin277]|nr:MAG: TPR repeat-containing protein YrrB [Candidatus Omnitrophica bacterium ADurb.Bin277]